MNKYIPYIFILAIVSYLLFLIRPALLGQLGGTFKAHHVPQEYIRFEKYLSSQHAFSRTFWIPSTQRFGFYSAVHPSISGKDFYRVTSVSGVLSYLAKDGAEKQLQEVSVRFIVIPFDSEGEIFLKDRKYDSTQYSKTIDEVRKISWLSEIPGFGRIHIFEVPNPKEHFWTNSLSSVTYSAISPIEYIVKMSDAKKGDTIVFAEGYDNEWKGSYANHSISSQIFDKRYNSFVLPEDGNSTLYVTYIPQQWIIIGTIISLVTLLGLLGGLLFLFLRK